LSLRQRFFIDKNTQIKKGYFMDRKSLEKYAEVVIEVGVNLYEGQCLSITSGVGNYDFALILAETAYKKGAKFVEIKVASNKLTRTRIDNSDISNLSYYPTSVTMEMFRTISKRLGNYKI
jgi:aminopeptidase